MRANDKKLNIRANDEYMHLNFFWNVIKFAVEEKSEYLLD